MNQEQANWQWRAVRSQKAMTDEDRKEAIKQIVQDTASAGD